MSDIEKACSTLSKRLWKTSWCVNAKKVRGRPCLVLNSNIKVPKPKRKTRMMRTWMGYPVAFETGQMQLF